MGQAKAVLLEPIMNVEVVTPEENMGDVIGDLNRRRGQVNSMGDRSGNKIVDAHVPLAEMFGYSTSLRSATQGRANFTMQFANYAEVPKKTSEQIIQKVKGLI